MFNQGISGPQIISDGQLATARMGKGGEQMASELRPRYFEDVYRGNTFYVASQAVATSTVGLATTYTGLCLSNPIASQKNLVLISASMMQSVIQSVQVEAYGLAFGFNKTTNVTHTAAVTTQSALIGSGITSVGLADSSATLPTAPVYGCFATNTATATQNSPGDWIDLGGQIILTPGAYVCWVTPSQASVAGLWFSFVWSEVAI